VSVDKLFGFNVDTKINSTVSVYKENKDDRRKIQLRFGLINIFCRSLLQGENLCQIRNFMVETVKIVRIRACVTQK
jgi:hypothetical protein